MGKSKELQAINEIVKSILANHPETRNSDNVLYIKVCERLNKRAMNEPFCNVFSKLKEFNLPPFETVRRTRQKLQATYPELSGKESVKAQRKQNENSFKAYAKGNV